MAITFTGGKLIENHLDVGADLHTLQINFSAEMLDATTFGSTTRKHQGGLKDASIDVNGYVNLASSQSDPVLFAETGAGARLVSAWTKPITIPSTNETGVGMNAVGEGYTFGGQVGTLLPFTFTVQSESDLVRTIALDNALSTAWSTDANTGTAVNVVHCTTAEKLYAGFHVTAFSTGLNGSISAVIQAASSSGFATSNNRISFTAMTCKAGVWATPIAASALSTDQPFLRSVVTVSSATSTGATANGVIWAAIQ